MAFSQTFEVLKPAGSQAPSVLDEEVRSGTKEALRERLDVDHSFPIVANTVDGDSVGQHKHATLIFHGTIASSPAGTGIVYVGTDGELYYAYVTGFKKLTNGGKINIAPADLVPLVDDSTIALNGSNQIAIKPGGITANLLAAAMLDPDTLKIVSDKLQVKDLGIGPDQLADFSVAGDKFYLPTRGSGASWQGVPITAQGKYTGTGADQTLTCFTAGYKIDYIFILGNEQVFFAMLDDEGILRSISLDPSTVNQGTAAHGAGGDNTIFLPAASGFNATGYAYWWFAISHYRVN